MGDGKTSMINLLSKSIENECMIIKFNPWNLSEDSNLYDKFFNELLLALELNDKENNFKQLRIYLKNYKRYVSPVLTVFGTVTQIITQIPLNIGDILNNYFYGKKSLEQLKKDISRELSNQKIIVIIDDIDRLTDENIRLIFNLIGSVANFKNIIYLLAYDREVVIKSLNKSQSFSGKDYLKKIVQLSISIPKITTSDLEHQFNVYLEKLYVNSLITKKDMDIFTQHYDIILGFFRNIRDLKYYFNLLILYLPLVKANVNVIDFMLLTVIQVFEKSTYNLIRENQKCLLYGKKGIILGNYRLAESKQHEIYTQELNSDNKSEIFYNILEKSFKKNSKLQLLMYQLFPKLKEIYEPNCKISDNPDQCQKKLISCPFYFDNYFIFNESKNTSDYDLDGLDVLTRQK